MKTIKTQIFDEKKLKKKKKIQQKSICKHSVAFHTWTHPGHPRCNML